MKPELQRGLHCRDCVLLVVGSMIGSGIFLTTGQIAEVLPAPWLILAAWLVGGAMALAGALSYAELGASFPQAGGHYVYLREAYGGFAGFLDGWLSFVASFPGSIAFISLGLVSYLPAAWSSHTISSVEALGLGWTVESRHLIAVGIILGLSAVNALGLRMGSGAQNLLAGLTIAALLGFAAFGLGSGRGQWGHFTLAEGEGPGLSGMGLALIGISFSYLGWDAATYMAAEVKQPQRVLPRALALATLLVVALYLLFNAALLYALPASELAAAPNAAAAVVDRLLGPRFAGVLVAAILVCILGSLNATIMVGPRVYYAMARDGLFPRLLGSVNRVTRVPVAAILAQGLWASVIVFSATLGRILAFTVLVIWLLSAITAAAVFILRWRSPGLERPYRTWGYPWVPALFCLFSLALAANRLRHAPADLLWLAGFLAVGALIYLASRGRGRAAPA